MAYNSPAVLINFTGDGRGKSSAAWGIAVTHAGSGKKVSVVQFIKNLRQSGSFRFFRNFAPDRIEIECYGYGFTFEHSREENQAAAFKGWEAAQKILQQGESTLLILDELNIVLDLKLLDLTEVLTALKQRRKDLNVIITGRNAPRELLALCDCVSVIQNQKHYFDRGVDAIKGIDY